MLALAIAAGLLIGVSLGALGGGGSILAVPVLVYLLDQEPVVATTGSLVIVGLSALAGAVAAWRKGDVLLARGVAFGVLAIAGAALGATASTRVDQDILLAGFAVLMLAVAAVMVLRMLRSKSSPERNGRSSQVDDPIITVSPTFMCNCPLALKVVLTASVVGLVTGFFGVGGGFLVVPALVIALGLPMSMATGTSLVVITLTSAAAFVVRIGSGVVLDWAVLAALTSAAVAGGLLGSRLATRADPRTLGWAFSLLILAVAVYTAWKSIPALLT